HTSYFEGATPEIVECCRHSWPIPIGILLLIDEPPLRVLQLQPKGLLRSKLDPSRHHRSRFDQGRFGRPW
ncbi:hypothetical protein E4U35_005213, partial [Claviceps purpurea]